MCVYIYIYYNMYVMLYMNHQPPALSQDLWSKRCRNFHPSIVTLPVVTGNAFYVPGNRADRWQQWWCWWCWCAGG